MTWATRDDPPLSIGGIFFAITLHFGLSIQNHSIVANRPGNHESMSMHCQPSLHVLNTPLWISFHPVRHCGKEISWLQRWRDLQVWLCCVRLCTLLLPLLVTMRC
jgi:hypothetical protein